MNLRSIAAGIVIFLALVPHGAKTAPAAAKNPSSGDIATLHGTVEAVNLSTRTLTLKTDKGSVVFAITDKTGIVRNPNSHGAKILTLDQVKIGEFAEVVVLAARRGTAVLVNLGSASRALEFLSSFSGKTASGQTISGRPLEKLIVFIPKKDAFSTSIHYDATKGGNFLMSVKPDGTVSNVEVLSSIGYRELDERAKKWFMKWRFQPNSVTQVQAPVSYGMRWH
jgi:TonB family protein